jgi:hypothetical protein
VLTTGSPDGLKRSSRECVIVEGKRRRAQAQRSRERVCKGVRQRVSPKKCRLVLPFQYSQPEGSGMLSLTAEYCRVLLSTALTMLCVSAGPTAEGREVLCIAVSAL